LHANEPDAFDYVDYRSALSETDENTEEAFANSFAASLLMPEKEVKHLHRQKYTPTQMAAYFGVSQDAVYYRLKSLGLTS
jgi:Zn-dependent peptidase ImmA (M78 family)